VTNSEKRNFSSRQDGKTTSMR